MNKKKVNIFNKKEKVDLKKNDKEKNCKDDLNDCQSELKEWKDKFLRVSADLNNFSRRMERERVKWIDRSQSDLVKEILTIVDDFERMSDQESNKDVSDHMKKWLSGFMMIGKSLNKILSRYGLKEITELKKFDPELHDAVAQVDSDKYESGEIVQVLQKGYFFKDQILRPAKVSVAK